MHHVKFLIDIHIPLNEQQSTGEKRDGGGYRGGGGFRGGRGGGGGGRGGRGGGPMRMGGRGGGGRRPSPYERPATDRYGGPPMPPMSDR